MKVKSTLLFGASGSFEEVTLKKWKRLRVLAHKSPGRDLKGLPRISFSLPASTIAIIKAQDGIRHTAALGKVIGQQISTGYQEFSKYPGQYAAWVKDMFSKGLIWNSGGMAFYDYYNVPIAKGSMLATPLTITSANSTSGILTYSFDATTQYGQQDDDLLTIFFLNPNSIGEFYESVSESLIYSRLQRRDEPPVTLTPGAPYLIEPDDLLHIWSFWERNPARQGKKINSTSTIAEFVTT
jgi:hypothetical protein